MTQPIQAPTLRELQGSEVISAIVERFRSASKCGIRRQQKRSIIFLFLLELVTLPLHYQTWPPASLTFARDLISILPKINSFVEGFAFVSSVYARHDLGEVRMRQGK